MLHVNGKKRNTSHEWRETECFTPGLPRMKTKVIMCLVCCKNKNNYHVGLDEC